MAKKELIPEEKEVKKQVTADKATSYANTADDKAQRDTKNATKDKNGQSTDTKVVELKAKGLQILTDYPEEQTVYMTANGFGFFKYSDACNHAETLSNKEVLTVNRK